jgi:hypothetical protein
MLEITLLCFGILMPCVMCLYLSMQEGDILEHTSYWEVSFVYTFSQLVDRCVT